MPAATWFSRDVVSRSRLDEAPIVLVVDSPARADRDVPTHTLELTASARREPTSGRTLLIGVAIFALAFALRGFRIASAYDVFLDETIYSRISAGAAVNGKLVFGAYPFFLHGPLSFYWQAGLIHLFEINGTALQVIDRLRFGNAVAGSIIAVMLFAIVDRVASRRAAIVAAGLFAFDPFIVSFDSRLFIEPFASMWVVLGYLLLLPLALGGKLGRWRFRSYLVGTIFGLALLSKETSAELYVLPLLWSLWRRWPLDRSVAWRAIVAMVLTYVPYPLIVFVTGGGQQFIAQKFNGVERMLGIVQATGYNRPGAPSFASRLTADWRTFLVTYILIGLGWCAVIYLCRKGNRAERFVAVWGAAAFVLLGFQIAQGTLEEQMFYYLVVPSIVVVCTAGDRLLLTRIRLRPAEDRLLGSGSGPGRRWRSASARTALILLVVAVFDLGTWFQVHLGTDAAIARTVSWVADDVPAGARIAPLVDGIQYLLPDYRLLFNPEAGDVSARQLEAAHAEIVLTSSVQVDQGYSAASPRLVAWLRRHARRRYSVTGTMAGTVTVWQISRELPSASPPGPEPLHPSAPISIGAPTYGHIDVASGD